MGFPHPVKALHQVYDVLIEGPAEYDNIIHIHQAYFICQPPEYHVHVPLESCWCIHESKGHDLKLKQALSACKGCFLSIIWVHWDAPVPRGQIQCRKVGCTSQPVQVVIHSGQWVAVSSGDRVESFVVHTEPGCAIFLADQHNWCSPWAV